MYLAVEILPLSLNLHVGLHLDVGLSPLEAEALVARDEVVEEQSVGAFLTVFGQNAYEQKVYDVGLVELQRTQYVPPAEGEELSAALLQGVCERRYGDAHTNHLMVGCVPVFDDGDEVEVCHGQIHLHVLLYLSVGELRVAIEVLEGLVHYIEYLLAVSVLAVYLIALQLLHLQVVALLDHLCDGSILLRHFLRHVELILHVVVVFLPSAHAIHVLWIVGVVVCRSLSAKLVVTVEEHSLGVHIGETERTDNLLHTFRLAVVFYCLEECFRHFDIVNEVDPTEANRLALPFLVGTVVDDSSHTTHSLTVAVCHEVLSLAEVEGCILVLTEGVHLIEVEVGHVVRITFIEFVVEIDKLAQVAARLNFLNLYC